MRFLANENFPDPSIVMMRAQGLEVASIRVEAQGAKDHEVISRARHEGSVILTLDKDYGELIFKRGVIDPPAVLFLRYRGRDPQAPARLVLGLLATNTELLNRFTVLEEDGVRQRAYR